MYGRRVLSAQISKPTSTIQTTFGGKKCGNSYNVIVSKPLNSNSFACFYGKESNHGLLKCKKFKDALLPERLEFKKRNKMCYKCSSIHRTQSCNRDVRSRFFETPTPILLQNYRILLQSCSGLRQKSKLQLLLLEEFLQTLQSQCYPNFRPMLNVMQVRLLVFRDCARTDASQRA